MQGETLRFEWAPELRRCPWATLSKEAFEYVEIWRNWKLFGVLPFGATVAEQPAHIYQAIEICEIQRLEIERLAQEGRLPWLKKQPESGSNKLPVSE